MVLLKKPKEPERSSLVHQTDLDVRIRDIHDQRVELHRATTPCRAAVSATSVARQRKTESDRCTNIENELTQSKALDNRK